MPPEQGKPMAVIDVLDPDAAQAQALSSRLSKAGYQAHIHHDADRYEAGLPAHLASDTPPSGLVLALWLGTFDGLYFLEEVGHAAPNLPVLLAGEKISPRLAFAAMDRGAGGVFSPTMTDQRLQALLHRLVGQPNCASQATMAPAGPEPQAPSDHAYGQAAARMRFLEPSTATSGALARPEALAWLKKLSPRQREQLAHLVAGLSAKESARALDLVSVNTVISHRKALYARVGVSGRAALTRLFGAVLDLLDRPDAINAIARAQAGEDGHATVEVEKGAS